MSLENEFIPYEQALELKELGFDEPCFTKFEDYFNKTKLHPILATLHLNTPYENEYNGYDQKIINNSSKRWFFTGHKNSVKDHNNDILSAPTFSQAFRWFREKYGINTVVECWNSEWKFTIQLINHCSNGNTEDCFLTYEEAELECLVKLIDIVKKQNLKN
jgi:hypothetical protein